VLLSSKGGLFGRPLRLYAACSGFASAGEVCGKIDFMDAIFGKEIETHG
jgi:hypothetical protein